MTELLPSASLSLDAVREKRPLPHSNGRAPANPFPQLSLPRARSGEIPRLANLCCAHRILENCLEGPCLFFVHRVELNVSTDPGLAKDSATLIVSPNSTEVNLSPGRGDASCAVEAPVGALKPSGSI